MKGRWRAEAKGGGRDRGEREEGEGGGLTIHVSNL